MLVAKINNLSTSFMGNLEPRLFRKNGHAAVSMKGQMLYWEQIGGLQLSFKLQKLLALLCWYYPVPQLCCSKCWWNTSRVDGRCWPWLMCHPKILSPEFTAGDKVLSWRGHCPEPAEHLLRSYLKFQVNVRGKCELVVQIPLLKTYCETQESRQSFIQQAYFQRMKKAAWCTSWLKGNTFSNAPFIKTCKEVWTDTLRCRHLQERCQGGLNAFPTASCQAENRLS